MTVTNRARSASLLATCVLLAACGSGRSILDAGNEPITTVATTSTTTTEPRPPETTPDGGTVAPPPPEVTVTTLPPTVPPTTAAPLDDLPPCPTEALDSAGGVVEITYWHGMNANNEQALHGLTDAYNASQSRVRVTLQNQGGYQEVFDKYYQSGASARPDLVMFPEWGFQQAIDSHTFVPAAACIESSGFDTSALLPQTLRAYAQGGVQWGMPFNVSNPLIYYNKVAFAAAGLDPERPPATFDELRQFSQQLVDSGAAGAGLAYDVNFDGGGGWYLEQWVANSGGLLVDNLNGRAEPATELLIDGPIGQRLFSELQSLQQDGLLVNVGDNASGTDAFLKLADPASPAAMTVGSSAALGTVIAVLGGGLIPGITPADVGAGPLPSFSGEPSVVVGGAANYVVAGDDARTAAAWDYITYLVSAQAQSTWAQATGYVPIADGATDLEPLASVYRDDPRFRIAYETLVNSPVDAAHAGATIGPHRQIRVQLATGLAAVFGGADVASTLAGVTAQSNALIAQYAALNQ
ncbi:MAG TPA: ABC transporter substrate-binding protein [Ilumatobacter sp.]|nr:ABC transporter substrate-binding protein [Ilumatobacter sp.]